MDKQKRIKQLTEYQQELLKKLQAQNLTRGARGSIIEAIDDITKNLIKLDKEG